MEKNVEAVCVIDQLLQGGPKVEIVYVDLPDGADRYALLKETAVHVMQTAEEKE